MNEINYRLLDKRRPLITTTRAKMLNIGTYLPPDRVKSVDLMNEIDTERRYGLDPLWMDKTMGISERRMSDEAVKPSRLAIRAAENALSTVANIDLDMIDAVLFCGMERDKPEPATAHIIQRALGLHAQHTFDIANACYGFIDGLKVGSALIETGVARNVLITTGEVVTQMARRVVDILKAEISVTQAKSLWGLLSVGDAGGAILLGPSETGLDGFVKFNQHSESRHVDLCSYEWKHDGSIEAYMKMAQIVMRGTKLHQQLYPKTMQLLKWAHFDWAVAHQTGKTTFSQMLKLIGLNEDRVMKTYPYLGNITSATFPLNYQKLISSDRLSAGDRVGGLFAGSGLVVGQFGYVV